MSRKHLLRTDYDRGHVARYHRMWPNENLIDYCVRLLRKNDLRKEFVMEVVEHAIEVTQQAEQMKAKHVLAEAVTAATASLHKEVAELRTLLSRSISVRTAEEERLKAAQSMRNRAAAHLRGEHDIPNEASEAIEKLPDPKPLWLKD